MNASILKALACSLALAATLLAAAPVARAQSKGRQRSRQARPTAQKPAASNPEYEQAVKLGDEARLARRFEDAIEQYGKALRIQPRWADGWWYVGAIFYEQDRYAEARDAFRNVVALDPNRGPAWGMLGLCEFQTREYERAGSSLLRGRLLGLGSHPELEAVVRYHAALLYIRFEEFEIAYDVLTEFVRVGHESPKVGEAFGLAILRMPFLPGEIPADKREQVLIAGRAALDMAARRMDQARSAFDTLMARYPNEPNVHYAHGVYLMSQDAEAAMKEFRRELEISPSHHPAMVQMAFEYLKRDEYSEALPLAEKAVQLAPKMFAARNVLGRVLLELGQVDRAIKELEEGTRLAPNSPEMRYALGRAYRRAGREADAKREVALFQKLQEQFNARRNPQPGGSPQPAAGEVNNGQPKPGP
ncbi:MAG: tetratricopeptide repeat protein [Pyrinomonadaceae bacterium]